MRVLTVNAGSSSLKLAVVEDDRRVAAHTVERWDGADLDGLRAFVDDLEGLDAVAHRVVHGGPDLTSSVRVTDDVLRTLDDVGELAPLHNPRAVAGIRTLTQLLPDPPVVACFDTAFHAGLPAAAATYALPAEWNQRWRLRRYGFHGLSHAYAVRRAATLVGRPLAGLRVVSCHLGAGASLAAVRDGRSVDTTMGFTPLAGLVMATRSGSVDPGVLLYLLDQGGIPVDELSHGLERRSGLAGLSGTSGDVREVLAGRAAGDAKCALAFDVFVHRLVREVGAMAASCGGLDLLVITGGIGEHSPEVRAAAVDGLAHLGVEVDAAANQAARGDADITADGTRVRTVVVTASEETEMAREAERVLASSG